MKKKMTYYGVAYDDGTVSTSLWGSRMMAEMFREVREGGVLLKSGVVFEVEVPRPLNEVGKEA